jgi:hypothetical protein
MERFADSNARAAISRRATFAAMIDAIELTIGIQTKGRHRLAQQAQDKRG